MPPRRLHLFFAFALGALAALALRGLRGRVVAPPGAASPGPPPATDPPPIFAEPKLRAPRLAHHPKLQHRLAVAALAVVFFAGAAFTAGAGDRIGALLEEGAVVETTAPETQALDTAAPETTEADAAPITDTATAEPIATEPAPAPADEPAPVTEPAPAPADEPAPVAEPAPETAPDVDSAAPEALRGHWSAPAPAAEAPQAVVPVAVHSSVAAPAAKPEPAPAAVPQTAPAAIPSAAPRPDPEADTPGSSAVVWVNVALPDPIPPSARLSPRFAKRLLMVAHRYRVDWALLLGAFRAEGARGSLTGLAARLQGTHGRPWSRVLAGTGRTAVADRAVALAHFNRAVGLAALVQGLDARKEALSKAILADERVFAYGGGREDLSARRIDVRVLAVIEYLADTFGQVTISSLESGHRLYARPGVVSAHVYGRAVDIAALDGTPIAGNQEPGGLTEDAVRALLLLPPEVRPLQVISLLGLGGPSFPLADHADHIHVGF
jgi:hypothetical protein